MDDLTREFIIESNERLDCMERSLTQLESRPSDPDLLAEIFRAVHTIKGTTGFLGFRRLESLAHSGENVLGQLRDGRITATPEVITLLLRTLDGLRQILSLIESEAQDGTPTPELDHALIRDLDDLAGATTHPPAEKKSKPAPRRSSKKKKSTSAEDTPASGFVAAMHARLNLRPAQELESPDEHPEHNRRATDSIPAGHTAAESTLRVDVELLNRMMNLVGELVLTRNQILQYNAANHGFGTLARRLDMVTADLRESVMKARMQPVSYIFQKFPRMVRDLCHICNKRVQLELLGQETELDKSLLEAIKDPLTHAVRNAIDHGMEDEARRIASGKPLEGTLRLRASQVGSHVIIEVIDDGKGIDPKLILRKALDKNLITPERAEHLSDHEIFQLIFLPGFSTAEKITSVSGRGVGMDVVRTNVEKIGGKVELESTPGHGTTLRLCIPLTLAIVPALVVRSGSEIFAIPQSALYELVYLSDASAGKSIEYIDNAPVYRLRDDLLPVLHLDHLFHLPNAQTSQKKYMVVLDTDGRRFGLVVDDLLDPEEIVVKPLSAVLRQVGFFSGATILGNGSLALIIDPPAIAQHANIAHGNASSSAIAPAQPAALEPEYLVYDAGLTAQSPRRMAVPLNMVDRIETVPFSRIEFADHAPVLQYLGSLLPLLDEGNLLREIATRNAPETPVHILVFHCDGLPGGIVVREVLSVTRGHVFTDVEMSSGTTQQKQIARIGDRVTLLQDLNGLRAHASLHRTLHLEVA